MYIDRATEKAQRKRTNIRNISDVREHAIETLDLLSKGHIDVQETQATAKVYDTIISTCKLEIEYGRYCQSEISVPFLEDAEPIQGSSKQKLLGDE